MNKIWLVEDIKLVIDEIGSKWNYPCNINVEISKRAKKRMGAFFFKNNNGKIEPIKFVFAQDLVSGAYEESIVKEVIIHEYLHYYCDTTTNKSNGHNKFFKECCIKSNISDSTKFKYYNNKENALKEYRYKIFCSKCNRLVCVHARRDAAENKIKKYISSCCKERLYLVD